MCFPRNADEGNRGLLRPSPPPAPESLTAHQGRLRRRLVCSGQGPRGRGSGGGLRTRKAFLEVSTPEATEFAKGRGRKSPNKETRGNAEKLFFIEKTLGSVRGVGCCHSVWFSKTRSVNAKAIRCCHSRWGQTPRGGEQRGHKEKGFAYLRSNEPGSDPSSVTRCAVCPTPSLRFASRVQRESKCKRPKQTFKASWVGVKGEGMVKLLGEKADTLEKPSQLGVLVPDVSKALLPKYPFQDLTSGLGAVGTPPLAPCTPPYLGSVHCCVWPWFAGPWIPLPILGKGPLTTRSAGLPASLWGLGWSTRAPKLGSWNSGFDRGEEA